MTTSRPATYQHENDEGFTIGELVEILQRYDPHLKPRARISVAFNAAGGHIKKITITEERKENGNHDKNS